MSININCSNDWLLMPDPKRAEALLATPFFFRFAVPCYHVDPLWSQRGVRLDEKCRLPTFASLDDAPDAPNAAWADVRAAWSDAGLAFHVHVSGKRQDSWCRATRVEDSDGLAVWIDTRNTPDIHRASRFCHAFRFLPFGGGAKQTEPVAAQLSIDRAREAAPQAPEGILKARSKKLARGYELKAFVPAQALGGYDPAEYPRLGFTYAVLDRELGEQTLTVGSEFPYQSDPSLWSTLELVR